MREWLTHVTIMAKVDHDSGQQPQQWEHKVKSPCMSIIIVKPSNMANVRMSYERIWHKSTCCECTS